MSDLCSLKIGCGSDKARKSLLVLAIPLAFRYLCFIRNSHIMGLLEPEV